MELISAAKNGNFDLAFSLLQNGYKCDVRDKDNATPLYWSSCHGHETLCEILLQAGSDVNARVKWGSTPLHAASDRGHITCVQVLLESGADINKQNSRGDTALHISAYRGFLDVTRMLLTSGADVTIRNEKCKMPEEEAMEGGHNDVAECIVQFTSEKHNQSNGAAYCRPEDNVQLPPSYDVVSAAISGQPREYQGETTPSRQAKISNVCRNMGSSQSSSLGSRDDSFTGSSSGSDVREDSYRDKYCFIEKKAPAPILRRSFSVGGSDVTKKKKHGGQFLETGEYDPLTQRTFSCGNMHVRAFQTPQLNDMNQSQSSASVGELNAGFAKTRLSETCENLTFPRYITADRRVPALMTSAGRYMATEVPYYIDDVTHMTSSNKFLNRPLRASTGSVRGNDHSENSSELIMKLQNQLIEAYKQSDKLSKENECLKAKCSTILNRLTDTEQTCTEKIRETETLNSMNDHSARRIRGLEETISELSGRVMCHQHSQGCDGMDVFLKQLDQKLGEAECRHFETILREVVRERFLTTGFQLPLSEVHKEWVPGSDYVILGDGPIRMKDHFLNDQIVVLLTFVIKQLKTGQRLLLKVYMLWHLPVESSGPFTPVELDVLTAMSSEPNIDRVLHSFQSSADRFRKFISDNIVADVVHCGLELQKRTTFIVTPFHSLSWASFEHFCCSSDSGTLSYGYYSSFITHVLYLTTLALSRLHACGIVHGNISETSVVFDSALRPVLVDLDDARLSHEARIPANNIHLKNDSGPDARSHGNEQIAQEAYSVDVRKLCRVFNSVLNDSNTSGYRLPGMLTSEDHLMHRLCQLIRHVTEESHPDLESFKKRLGYLLLYRHKCEVYASPLDCDVFIRARLLRLLCADIPINSVPSDQKSDFSPGNIIESIRITRPEVEADFLLNTTARQLWDLQSYFNSAQ